MPHLVIQVKLSLRELKQLIKLYLVEAPGDGPTRPRPTQRNPLSPDINSREQLDSLKQRDIDTDDGMDLPPHLREPVYDAEECFGPVPPTGEEPYMQQDPLVRDYSPLPSSRIMR